MKKLWIMLVFLIMQACAEQTNTSEIIVAAPVEPADLTPFSINEGHSYRVRWQIFDRLITADTNGNLIPALATEWKVLDPTTIQLKIRQGVKFHDGSPLTIEDVKYSIDMAINASTLKSTLGVFKDSEIVDAETINVTLFEPNASAVSLFSASGLLIANKASMEAAKNGDPELAFNGTGPFKFVQWNRGQDIILAKNPDFWGTPVQMDKVVYRIIPDPSVRMIAVETGEVDVAYDIDGSDREIAMNNPDVKYLEEKGSRMDYLGMTETQEPFGDPRIRKAVALVLDRDGMINSVMFGSAGEANSVIADSILYSINSELPKRERNIEEAKALMLEAGVAEGTTVDLWAMEGFRKKLAEIVQANLAEIGLTVNIKIYEWATYVEGLARGEAPMFFLGWTTNPLDADAGIYAVLHSSSRGSGGNYTMYNNAELDNLLDIGRNNNDPTVRADVYAKAQQLIYNQVPIVPLFYLYNNVAVSKDIKEFQLNPFGYHELKYIKK